MSITILLPEWSLNNRSNEEVMNILTDKVKDKGFEINCFYKPYSTNAGLVFRFDLQSLKDEEFLANKLDQEVIFDETKILKPRTKYESIIRLKKDLSHELLEKKIKNIKDFISLDNKAGQLTFNSKRETSNQLYLTVNNYLKYEEIHGKIYTNKQELNVVSIELNQYNKIGKASKTSLNQNEITAFFQQENYDEVIKDLRQFMTSICEFLSTCPNTPVNSSDTDLKKALEPLKKDNSEESEPSSISVANLTKSKPKLIPRPQLINSFNSKSTEIPEPIEKANGEQSEPSSSSDEISTESKSIN
ncbi:hypothetical protein [Synechocystis sp. CACIAM 05]|uniref:hypothetical protein n=1 Tax=Synechocystis sp. CACIAM 05 TaxID=1933929 RepID=UPI00138E56DC|nr:hypothetical protein [Synechocystis sp. CACIAM 05]QHV00596.1 hypothetical protein BWK47_10985 [Synechocystis sp. CACIAM 05]